MIKKDAHLGGGKRTTCCVLQHCTGLLKGYAREKFNELAYWHTIFEVLKQS